MTDELINTTPSEMLTIIAAIDDIQSPSPATLELRGRLVAALADESTPETNRSLAAR